MFIKPKITIDRSAVNFILKTFSDLKMKCRYCNKRITKENWGALALGIGMVCKSLPCLIEFSDAQEKESEGGERQMEDVAYPRVYVSGIVHRKVKRAAKKEGVSMLKLGDKVVRAGLKALGY